MESSTTSDKHSDKEQVSFITSGKYIGKSFIDIATIDFDYFKDIRSLFYQNFTNEQKRHYDRLCRQLARDEKRYDKENIIVQCIDFKKRNVSIRDAIQVLKVTFPSISHIYVSICYEEAKKRIKQEFAIEKEFLVDLHILRYAELYEKAINPDLERIPLQFRKQVLAESYMTGLNLLIQEERLLGIHTKTFRKYIKAQSEKEKREKKKFSTNIDVLTLEQQIELLHLIEETRVDYVVRTNVSNNDDEVVEEAVIVESNLLEAPIRQSKQSDEIGDKEREIAANAPQVGRTLYDIQTTVRDNVKKQLEEALKKQKK